MVYLPSMVGLDENQQRRMNSAFNPLVNKNKPLISISLADEREGAFVPSFTTLEQIRGVVSVTSPIDVQYQELHIIFQGSTKTYVEKVVTAAPTNPRTQAYHNFLRLTQPMEGMELPEDNIARAGVTYKLPFTFVVPERLLPQACTHQKENDAVEEAHLQLPPSLGDPMMASDGKSLLDDMSPSMTVVSYGIRVVMTKNPAKNSTSTRPVVITDAMKKIRIVPAAEEQPPLRVSEETDDDYITSKSKCIKKGMFKGKLGTISVSAPQPAPFRLPYFESASTCPVTSMATVDIRFDPTDAHAKPPRLGQLLAKLKVATYFATTPVRGFPTKSATYQYDSQRGLFVETVNLSSRSVESTQWTKHTSRPRRDSGIDLPSSPADQSSIYYTSQVLVPISLPASSSSYKTFTPTFHTCLISRIYALDLLLQVHSPSATVGVTSLHLKLPIQIAAAGNPDARPVISEDEAASIARREADNAYEPRNVGPPPADYTADTRGARGSIFQPPRWGSASGSGDEGSGSDSRRSSMLVSERRAIVRRSSPEAVTFRLGTWDERREEGSEGATDAGAQRRLREVSEEREAPPGYTSFNGRAAFNRSSIVAAR